MPSAIVTSTIQAGLLSAVSNILAQVLTAWRTQVCGFHLQLHLQQG